MIGYLAGCQPEKQSLDLLKIRPGSFADTSGNIHEVLQNFFINLNSVGCGGLDVGPATPGDYFVYAIRDEDGYLSFILSHSIIYGGVILPDGWTMLRKLPWGFVYNSSWGGIPNFHLSYWPLPKTLYTDFEKNTKWMCLNGGVATDWTTIDLKPWMPDNARVVHLAIKGQHISAGASAYLRTYDAQVTGEEILSIANNSVYQFNKTDIRVMSDRTIQYRWNDSGGKLWLSVKGYSQTECS